MMKSSSFESYLNLYQKEKMMKNIQNETFYNWIHVSIASRINCFYNNALYLRFSRDGFILKYFEKDFLILRNGLAMQSKE